MKIKHWVIGLIAVGVCIGVGAVNWYIDEHNIPFTGTVYSGKVIFDTEEDYVSFKKAIAQPEIVDWKVEAVSSKPPILVTYSVKVPYEYNWNYAKDYQRDYRDTREWPFWLFLSSVVLGLPTVIALKN